MCESIFSYDRMGRNPGSKLGRDFLGSRCLGIPIQNSSGVGDPEIFWKTGEEGILDQNWERVGDPEIFLGSELDL